MPNPTDRNEENEPRKTDDSGAEIKEEMERRLSLGDKSDRSEGADPKAQGDTVVGRAAAARSAGK